MAFDNKGQVDGCQRSSCGVVLVYGSWRSDSEIVGSRQHLRNSSEITELVVKAPEKGFLELVAVSNLCHL